MSRGKFAEYFDIPYRTIQNWELGLRECPEYLLKLMQYKLTKEGVLIHRIHVCPKCGGLGGSTETICPNCGVEMT